MTGHAENFATLPFPVTTTQRFRFILAMSSPGESTGACNSMADSTIDLPLSSGCFAKMLDDCFGDVIGRMRLADRNVNRGLPVKGQPLLVSRSGCRFIRGQRASRAVLLNPPPAQVERRVQPDGDSKGRHQFAVFRPRDRAASGSDD